MSDLKNVEKLMRERDYYKNLLIQNKIEFKPFEEKETSKLSSTEKINLYMDYFKGRTDVFAERWESKGKSGYSPICANKFIIGVCDIQKYKCRNCPTQKNKQLTKEDITNHIKGNTVVGVYPMLDDDTCYFLAVDFDEDNFKEAVNLFVDECRLNNLDCLVELSRSGSGAHVWFFFMDKYPAVKIRKIISSILTTTMLKSGKISFSSYDRMFPAQDKVLKNGIGNLIALPLNGKSGKTGTTVFVDKDFVPYENQFEVLKRTKKISIAYLNELYKKLDKDSENGLFSEDIKKYKLSSNDFSDQVVITLKNEIRFSKNELSQKALKYFMRMASFLNSKYYECQAKRLSVYNIPRVISLYKIDEDYLYLPRGCFDQVIETLNAIKVRYIINDQRIMGENIDVSFKGTLKEEQELGLNQLMTKENGIFVAPTGFGKTVVASALIAKLKVNTLILVNNKNLCEQWKERLNNFLQFGYESNLKVGVVHSLTKQITNKIDIALIQSLATNENLRKSLNNYGLIIFDEAHHLAAVSYENVVRSFSSKYIYGFTATPNRSDGYEKINYMVIGPCIFNYSAPKNETYKKILYPHFTKFKLELKDKTLSLTDIENKLIEDDERNNQIITNIKDSINENRKILILTNRVEHAMLLFDVIKEYTDNVFIIYGNASKANKEEFKKNLSLINDEQFVIISTGKYIGEGFDEKRLDTLFLTMPFKWRGTLQQYVGRLHRDDENKVKVEVHDYVDINVPIFFRMYLERQKGYKNLNYTSIDKNNQVEMLFDENSYYNRLVEDLETAQSIKFYIQYANIEKLNILLEKCAVDATIYSSEELENIKSIINENIKFNMVIINDRILWYGGINPFIFKKDNSMIARLEDKGICNNIITNFE